MKTLYIIAGCNGAGKSTAAKTLLPQIWQCRQFVNADEIARGLSPFDPESMSVQAGRLMLEMLDKLLKGEESFSVETTLATRSYVSLVDKAHACGFRVSLLFLWLNTPEMARLRVNQRVAEGGHNIEDEVIRRRYKKGLHNLFNLFIPISDEWMIYDNSVNPRVLVASGSRGAFIDIHDAQRLETMRLLAEYEMPNKIDSLS